VLANGRVAIDEQRRCCDDACVHDHRVAELARKQRVAEQTLVPLVERLPLTRQIAWNVDRRRRVNLPDRA